MYYIKLAVMSALKLYQFLPIKTLGTTEWQNEDENLNHSRQNKA